MKHDLAITLIGKLLQWDDTYHGWRPSYLAFYAAELAWRHDVRKMTMKTKVMTLMKIIMASDISLAFRGYVQGRRLEFEYIG
jgi:hypothetical protein